MLNQILSPILEYFPENNRLERIWKLAEVDFRRRYYDNLLGLFWALINPLFRVAVYYFAFTQLLEGRMENYALYLFSGIIFWLFFTEGTNKGLTIMVQKKYLIENIQFNKLDLFYSSTLSVFIGFMFNLLAYLAVSIISGVPFYGSIAFFPLLVINMFILVLSVSMFLATLNIYIKDIKHLWAMLIMAGFWVTPIFLPREAFSGKFEILLYMNPVAGIIINVREVLLYGRMPEMNFLLWNFAYAVTLLATATILFKYFSHKAVEKY